MKHAVCILALAPLLGASPALAQTPAAPAAAAPKPAAAAPKPAAAPAVAAPAAAAPAAAAPVTPTPAPTEAAPAPVEAAPTPAEAAPVAAEAAPAPAPALDPAPDAPPAPAPEPASLELFGMLAPSVVQGEPANPGLTNSFRRVGVYGEAGVAYRSKYFLDPFISVGYGTLSSGDTTLPEGEYGAGGTVHQHLGMWLISPGVTAELWRFRLRFGIGLGLVAQSNRFQGEKNSTTQLAVAWDLGLAYTFYQRPHFRLDAEARVVQVKGADVAFWTLGVTGRGDLITF